jgi:hypothetical protein
VALAYFSIFPHSRGFPPFECTHFLGDFRGGSLLAFAIAYLPHLRACEGNQALHSPDMEEGLGMAADQEKDFEWWCSELRKALMRG